MDENLNWLKHTARQPSLYFRRLMIFDDPEQEPIREVPFRRGLNLVWAKEPTGDQTKGKRTAGHGVGKTSLCLLLRFCLGDDSPNVTSLRKELAESIPKGGVALVVECADENYVIYRSYKYRKTDKVVRGDSLTDLWQGTPACEISDFFESLTPVLLQHASCPNVPETGQTLEWRHLLAWLARDQEARFKSFYAWREGEGVGLQRSRQDPPVLLRSVLGLLKPEESELLTQLRKAKQDLENATQHSQALLQESHLIKTRIEADIRNIDPELSHLPLHRDDLFSPSLVESIKSKRNELKSNIEKWQGRDSALEEERSNALRFLHPLEEEYRRIEQRLMRSEAGRTRNEREFTRLTAELDHLKQLPGDCQEACIPFSECTHVKQRIQSLELPSIQGARLEKMLKIQMDDAGRDVERYQDDLMNKQREIHPWKHSLQRLNEKREKQLRIRDRIIEQKARYTNLLTELERWESRHGSNARQERIDRSGAYERECGEVIDRLEVQLTQLRESRNASEKRLDYIIQHLTEDLLSGEFSGTFDPRSEDYPFRISVHGGEAYRVLEVLLGDLACLLYSVSNESAFPGVLIHDCPREADMGPRLYEDYLSLVAAIEHNYANREDGIPFQYIVTTTSPPPSDLNESEKVILALHPEDEKEMLFRRRLRPSTQNAII